MKTATKGRAAKSPAGTQEPTHWERLQEAIVNCPDDMLEFSPEIIDAVALIKHAGPEPRWLESLAIALRILVGETIKCARNIHLFEPSLVAICEHLHNHIESFGLFPGDGKWKRYDDQPLPGVDLIVFPLHRNAVRNAARLAKGGG